MTLSELKNRIDYLLEAHGDLEIQMVLQPNYPLKSDIDGVAVIEKTEGIAYLFGKGYYNMLSINNNKKIKKVQQVKTWLEMGKRNRWIAESSDPPFTEQSFHECKTIAELKEKFDHGNWCLGQAFYYQNLCFINQVNGGDEWLTIKNNLAFESITFAPSIRDGEFEELIDRLLKATIIQCAKLEY